MAHNQDWREWLESLNASGAEYVVVGGIALAHHGLVRYTGDIDVLVKASEANAERVLQALRAFGFGSVPVRFISLAHLVRNKRATGRPQDAADADRLGG